MSKREHVIRALDSGIRYDGRKLDEFRKINVGRSVIKSAEGSARVEFGDTQIIAGVKMGVEKPYPDTPQNGNLMVNVELLPLSNPDYEAGPPSEEAVEIARIIDRGIREGKCIDTEKLCIAPKEAVWSVMIDVVTMNTNGNVIDASALASVIAVLGTKFPSYEDGAVKYDKITDTPLPVDKKLIPITVTVYKIGKHLVVDPLQAEEEVADARISVAVIEDGSLVALQKGGESPLSSEEVEQMTSLAVAKAKELRAYLK